MEITVRYEKKQQDDRTPWQPAQCKREYDSNGHLEHTFVSSCTLLLDVDRLVTWKYLCLEPTKDDGVEDDQQDGRDKIKRNKPGYDVISKR